MHENLFDRDRNSQLTTMFPYYIFQPTFYPRYHNLSRNFIELPHAIICFHPFKKAAANNLSNVKLRMKMF